MAPSPRPTRAPKGRPSAPKARPMSVLGEAQTTWARRRSIRSSRDLLDAPFLLGVDAIDLLLAVERFLGGVQWPVLFLGEDQGRGRQEMHEFRETRRTLGRGPLDQGQ